MLHSRLIKQLLIAVAISLWASTANAALISRPITIDGDMTDWTATPSILANTPDQVSFDCDGTIAPGSGGCDLDYQVQSTGRDLELFSFTWDTSNIYLYVRRYASTSNATDWWFYLDTDNSTTMNDNEPVVHVDWNGANRNTSVELCEYDAVNNSAGDALASGGTADGYDMPGSIIAKTCVAQYSAQGGANSGVEMEIAIAWSALSLSGPANVGFHISSSNGANIPTQLDDNMSGPGGGTVLFPPDMAITKIADNASVQAGLDVVYTITLENLLYDDFTNITVDDQLPTQFEYVTHTVTSGSFVDTDADTVPDQWQLPSLAAQASATLTITARALNVPLAINTTNTATISGSTETDSDPSNDVATAVVQVLPAPELTVTKVSSSSSINPGQSMTFTVSISNIATVGATDVLVTDALPQFSALGLKTFSGQPFRFTPGTPAPGVTLGTPEYSSDGGTNWNHTPDAAASFDAAITHFRIPMIGTLNASGANFQIEYATRIE